MKNPTVRLIARAVLVGLVTAAVQLQRSTNWDRALISSAVVAGVLAAAEVLTPLNAAVGVGKT